MEKWGIWAGRGYLPLEVAEGMKKAGIAPTILGISEEVGPYLEEAGYTVTRISLGELGAACQFLREENVTRLVMAGKVGKEVLFSMPRLDEECQLLLFGLKEKSNDAILEAVVGYLAANGIHMESQARFLRHILAVPGVLVGEAPTPAEEEDIRFGFRLAKEIGRLDIGQTVLVKNGVVLAIEAIEGTDQAIQRGGYLGGKGAIAIKVAKPSQNPFFDLPVVGLGTIEAMIKSNVRILVVEAGVTFILQREELLKQAQKSGITVMAIT